MLNKISGLARALYIVLAIVAGFMSLGMMNVPLAIVVLGLIAGISTPRERLVLALAAVIAAPIIGTALSLIPAVGAQLNAVMLNLQIGIAGAAAMAMAILLYEMVMDGVTGMMGGKAGGTAAATA